jgi:ABC-2 type transport system permease protein
VFRYVFTFAIPMLLVSNVPARVLTNKLENFGWVLLLLAMAAACFAVSELGWRASLRRYTSASS